MLSYLLHLCLANGLFPYDFFTKAQYAFFFFPLYSTCPTHLILHDSATLIIFGEEWVLWPIFVQCESQVSRMHAADSCHVIFRQNYEPFFIVLNVALIFLPQFIVDNVCSWYSIRICLYLPIAHERTQGLVSASTGMRRITTFRSTTDRIYDSGPIIL